MRIVLLVVMLLMIGCSNTNNWPYPMTPFFAECEYEGIVFVDHLSRLKRDLSIKKSIKFQKNPTKEDRLSRYNEQK